jgi:IS5 family transposase
LAVEEPIGDASNGQPSLSVLFERLDLSWAEPILLTCYSNNRRRRPHSPLGMLKALVFQRLRQIQSWRKLAKELQANPATLSLLGLSKAPCHDSFSEFTKRIGPGTLRTIMGAIIQRIREALPEFGRIIATDSTLVRGYSNWRKRPRSDLDANWGVSGEEAGKPKYVFGYKLHIACDAYYGLPILHISTPANKSDSTVYGDLIKALPEMGINGQVALADAGYDSKRNTLLTIKHRMVPIIAYNPRRSRNKKGRRADYILPVRRDSEEWVRLYSMRSAVERIFSRLKLELGLERLLLRRLRRVDVHFTLTLISMLLLALGSITTEHPELVRSIEPWRY